MFVTILIYLITNPNLEEVIVPKSNSTKQFQVTWLAILVPIAIQILY